MDLLTEAIRAKGFAIIERLLSEDAVGKLVASIELSQRGVAVETRRGRSVYARRNILTDPEIAELSRRTEIMHLVCKMLGPDAFPVRGIFFDKTPDANWVVPWHQDLSIAVREKRDVAGFGPWSEKAGVVHVQPTVDVLKNMLTVRLHLDDCGLDNGPLRVIPTSHLSVLKGEELAKAVAGGEQVCCLVPAGSAVVMRPLILHASSPAAKPEHRRVIHIEYASGRLPGGLEWYF